MDNRRIMSALCYFSILFVPFLLPITIYFLTPDKEVKHHAKRSLISHLIPVGLGIIGFIILIVSSLSTYSAVDFTNQPSSSFDFLAVGIPIMFMFLYAILSIIVLIWNIIQGIKVLQ